MITRILLALIYVQNSLPMPHLAVIELIRVIIWPRSDSDGSCVDKNVRDDKGFYSTPKGALVIKLPLTFLLNGK